MDNCPICGKPAAKPYRRYLDKSIVEGCVSSFHDGAEMSKRDQAWHDRGEAQAIRGRTEVTVR